MRNNRLADRLKGQEYSNPFSDFKNISSTPVSKMRSEFVPTSFFWSLFSNQNEIVIGTRGSGKTILFRMMAYSMLRRLENENAKRIVGEKQFFALYVPMEEDFVESITNRKLSIEDQERWFVFATNCLMVKSFVSELKSLLEDYPLEIRLDLEYELSNQIARMWNIEDRMRKTDLSELRFVVENIFVQQDRFYPVSKDVPAVFTNTVCGVIESVVDIVCNTLKLDHIPTWIICIDEAEYLKDHHIALLSRRMRSNIYHVVIKIADLPYYHSYSDKHISSEQAAVGNDYIKTILRVDEKDFETLTNNLCKARLQKFYNEDDDITLESFLGKVGRRDDYRDYFKDYFKKELGRDITTNEINEAIKKQISNSRRETSEKSGRSEEVNNQSIYKKLAPIYYVREMKNRKTGNNKLPWFAGAKMVRRISQGNPRIFLRIMGTLFNVALEKELNPSNQHEALVRFSSLYRSETQSLEKWGDVVYKNLEKIGTELQNNVHGDTLKECGTTFKLKESSFSGNTEWLAVAIAYSRLFIENLEEVDALSSSVEFSISHLYAVLYWIPMRKDNNSITIQLEDIAQGDNSHVVQKNKEEQKDGD